MDEKELFTAIKILTARVRIISERNERKFNKKWLDRVELLDRNDLIAKLKTIACVLGPHFLRKVYEKHLKKQNSKIVIMALQEFLLAVGLAEMPIMKGLMHHFPTGE